MKKPPPMLEYIISSNCGQNKGPTVAFHNVMNHHPPWRSKFPISNSGNVRTLSSAALRYGRLKDAETYKKKTCLSHGFERIVYKTCAGKEYSSFSSSFWAWFMKHKFLGFAIISTLPFMSLEWIPVSERMHLAISSDEIDNMAGAIAWEVEAIKHRRQILSPDRPESIRITRILKDILQATHQILGLKNDFQVSIYVPRKELQLKDPKDPTLPTRIDFFKFHIDIIKYYSSHPNKRVQNKPQKVRRKFGIRYGTEHLEGLNWEVMVVDRPIENAAHFPNGRITFPAKLFDDPDFTDEDLATIIAYEVGHQIARHSSEYLLRLICFKFICGLVKPFLGEGLFFSKVEPLIKNIIFAFAFIRREMEADLIGIMLMAAAGYDPLRALEFHDKYGANKRAEALKNAKMMIKAKNVYDQVRAGGPRS
ncbi:OLC1v1031561C1 [Oldenlandia corymbosa var. corymbosa]|uniref:OLC1v1031561C1 n=1 Tax=Oldenlandia corymbosa var. corymbosa TaxID=529605 RepID=A0AAV1CKK3_OLDCO|nr:OLC1v1031561C1 [Oldenlandia corymbosa var. corymbosa]